ncbi:PrgI family protein [Streptomyces boninensis]|uniref:PrgI family protein n=1 Tax=Streptomyces boninensis TaxID=2039455 RepID=UPI003B21C98C
MSSQQIRIPSNVDRPDTLFLGLTARQVLILSVTGMVLYLGWQASRPIVPLAVYAVVAVPLAITAAALALGERDGLPLDQLALAAVRHHLSPRIQVAAAEGVLPPPQWIRGAASGAAGNAAKDMLPAAGQSPVAGVSESGLVDLGQDGVALVAVCSTVNFALRTPAEQEALVATFGRYLHSLTAPVQVVTRTERLDLSGQVGELRSRAPGLPHPALEAAAREHADFVEQLGRDRVLLRRQVLLVLREPLAPGGPTDGLGGASPLALLAARSRSMRPKDADDSAARRAAGSRLVRRAAEARELLNPAGIEVTVLDAGRTTGVLASACSPGSLIRPSSALATADEVITTAVSADDGIDDLRAERIP